LGTAGTRGTSSRPGTSVTVAGAGVAGSAGGVVEGKDKTNDEDNREDNDDKDDDTDDNALPEVGPCTVVPPLVFKMAQRGGTTLQLDPPPLMVAVTGPGHVAVVQRLLDAKVSE
jgi:hypothetical protein